MVIGDPAEQDRLSNTQRSRLPGDHDGITNDAKREVLSRLQGLVTALGHGALRNSEGY